MVCSGPRLQCESMKAICGESMMIMESCPLQFNCPTCTCGEACTMSSGSVGECGEDGMTCAMFFAPPNCTTTTADTGGMTGVNSARWQELGLSSLAAVWMAL
ncbi:unnamed protein product [Effrenium voratum]|nr:unnamed protein product [Effrenium voratum]